MSLKHPLLVRLIRKSGAKVDEAPSLDIWHALLGLVGRTYYDADQDRYTIERAMEISSIEMHRLYEELELKSEHELARVRSSEERHKLLFESSPLPIWVIDAETLQFLAVNNAMIKTYGYSRDELLTMGIADLKLPEDVAEMVRGVRDSPLDRVHHVGVRKHRCKNGSVVEMDITVHKLTFEGRRASLGVALDTTRARRLEEELRQSQKMEAIGQLAGGIAHDFNNILGVILANADFAIEELGEDHAVATELVEIKKAASRAAGLTRQLLTFSRKQKRQLRPIALNAVVTGVEAMLTRIVGEDITMSTMIAPDLGTIEADPGEVEQVLMNLVVNARDAMPLGGRLILETINVVINDADAPQLGISPGRYIELAVTDTGCGMTDSVRGRIFEPFFTTKEVDKGTGLGLSTVFGIIKECRGGIGVHSEPGLGTTFRVYWPRTDVIIAKASESRFVPKRCSGTILVVEDDIQLRHVLRRYLTSWGYTLLEASNAASALELVHNHAGSIDLLLTDLVMPGIDGRSLSQQVLVAKPNAKVVFMSGYTEHPALKNAALGPGDLFMQKPFSPQTLSETIDQALVLPALGLTETSRGSVATA